MDNYEEIASLAAGWTFKRAEKLESVRFETDDGPERVPVVGEFVHKGKIYAEGVVVGNKLLRFPEALSNVFYISSLKVMMLEYNDAVYELFGVEDFPDIIAEVTGRGFSPHLYHLKSGRRARLCVGEMQNKPIDNLGKLAETLRYINPVDVYRQVPSFLLDILITDVNHAYEVYARSESEKCGRLDLYNKFMEYRGCLQSAEPEGEVFRTSRDEAFHRVYVADLFR